MKTPLWIFDNEWFRNTTYLFSAVSISAVSIMTMIEAMKLMTSGLRKRRTKVTDLKTIGRRWFIVAGATTVIPFAFQKGFQVLNWVSDLFIQMGASNMKTVGRMSALPFVDILILGIFDLILISTVIPTLWKNGRRFFDLMILGVISPLALTAWIFDSKRHLFDQWWSNLKHLSLVQVYQSLFMLVLGWFIFGIPTPDSFIGFIAKLLVVIGGFGRLQSPPRLVSGKLDNGKGLDDLIRSSKDINKNVRKNFRDSGRLFTQPHSAGKIVYERVKQKLKTPERTGNTRMDRFHSNSKPGSDSGLGSKIKPRRRR